MAFWHPGGDDTRVVLNPIRRLRPVRHGPQEALAHEILDAVAYDFGPLCESSLAFSARPDRHGVRVVVLPTDALPEPAIEALLAWRLGQYLLAGFSTMPSAPRSCSGDVNRASSSGRMTCTP